MRLTPRDRDELKEILLDHDERITVLEEDQNIRKGRWSVVKMASAIVALVIGVLTFFAAIGTAIKATAQWLIGK